MKKFSLLLALILSISTLCAKTQKVKIQKPSALCNGVGVTKHSTPYEILNIWGELPKEQNELFKIAQELFEQDDKNNYAAILQNERMLSALKAAGKEIVAGPMLGDVGHNKMSVWVRTIKPSEVKVIATDTKGKKVTASANSSIESDLSAVVKLKGLKPTTSYTYSVFVDGKELKFDDIDLKFTTPIKPYTKCEGKILFGSCYHRWGLGNLKMTKLMMESGADALVTNGDIAVQDRKVSISGHCIDHFLRDMTPAWRKFAAQTPTFATWDDHDYMNNDLAGLPKSVKAEGRDNIRTLFTQSWANPYYGTGKDGIFLHTTVGAADIIMLDNRYFRENKVGSFLGKEQTEWLKKTLLESKSPFKILSCGTMFSDYVSAGKDSWGTFDPEGRAELFKFIVDNNISGVLLISGDRHGARGFGVPLTDDFMLYEFNGASLGGRSGPAATSEKWTTQLYGISYQFAFSEFTFRKENKQPVVDFKLIHEDSHIVYERTFTLKELTPKK